MTTEPHPAVASAGEERHRRVRDMFAGIAARYEFVNRVASGGLDAGWRRAVVAALDCKPGDWCLDVCCGTGDLSRAVAATGARLVGADFCRPMLAEGAARSRVAGVVGWLEADARRLPLRTGSMDAACVAFGIRNVVPPADGLAEMIRVVRPGGRVVVLEFSEPPNRAVRAFHGFYLRRVLPLAGDLLSGRWGTYRYLPQTIGGWMSPEALAGMLRDAGLEKVRFQRLTLGTVALHQGVVGAR